MDFTRGVPDAALYPWLFDHCATLLPEYAALKASNRGYGPNAGIELARRAVIGSFTALYPAAATAALAPENVLLTSGCTVAGMAAMRYFLLEARHTNHPPLALLQSPTYHFYKPQLKSLDASLRISIMPDVTGLDAAARLAPIENALKIHPHSPVLLVLNSPANPTGDVYPRAFYQSLAQLVQNQPRLWVLEDTIYERLVFAPGVRPESLFALVCSDDSASHRVLHVSGLSKAYAYPGGRLGYLISHPATCRVIDDQLDLIIGQLPIDGQLQLACALTQLETLIPEYHTAFNNYLRHNAGLLNTLLSHTPSLGFHPPQGGIYGFVTMDDATAPLLHQAAAAEGLLFPPIRQFDKTGLRFNLSVNETQFARALMVFAEVCRMQGLLLGTPPEPEMLAVPRFDSPPSLLRQKPFDK